MTLYVILILNPELLSSSCNSRNNLYKNSNLSYQIYFSLPASVALVIILNRFTLTYVSLDLSERREAQWRPSDGWRRSLCAVGLKKMASFLKLPRFTQFVSPVQLELLFIHKKCFAFCYVNLWAAFFMNISVPTLIY